MILRNFEQELIKSLERRHRSIGDDCALFENYVITTDTLVEGVHFSTDISTPYQVGVKTACANLSDIASMGAKPLHFLVSISIPSIFRHFPDDFYRGLEDVLNRFDVKLLGGDTTGSPHSIFINGVAIGEASKPVLRSGAKVGDYVYLTGVTGYSAIGFYLITNKIEIENPTYAIAVKKHLEPEPPVKEGMIIGENSIATAMIDISDGLSKEIRQICEKSGVGCVLYSELFLLPEIDLFPEEELLKFFLHSGEEYVLLFTSPFDEDHIKKFLPEAFLIGEITGKKGVMLEYRGSLVNLGDFTYNHFGKDRGIYFR